MVLVEHRAQGVAAVAQQMEPVCHLDGVRGAPGGSLGIGAGAVADHGGHAGMVRQPRRQRVGAAVGQQVDHAPALQVDQDGAVALALAPRPVVHAQHAHPGTGHGVAGAHTREQRRAADRHAHRGGVARAGIAAQRQADGPVHRAQPVSLAGPGLGDAGQRFGEGPARTCRHRAPEPTNPDEQKRRAAETGDVAEAAPVGAVDPPGRDAARGTGCRGHGRLRSQRHPAGIMVDLVEDLESGREADRMQRGAQERYRIEGCFLLYGDPSRPSRASGSAQQNVQSRAIHTKLPRTRSSLT